MLILLFLLLSYLFFYFFFFFFSSRRRHTRFDCDWSSDVCSSDLTFRWVRFARSELTDVIEVRFKGNRKEFFSWPSAEPLALHDCVIVEVDRGQDLGRVSAVGPVAAKKCASGCHGCSLAGNSGTEPPAPSPQSPEHRIL